MKSFLVKLQNSFPIIILHQNTLVRDSFFLRVQLFYINVDRKSWVQHLQHKLLLAYEIWSILIAVIVNFHNVTFRIWIQSGSSIKYVRKIFRKTNISKPPDTHTYVKMLVFRKILRTYLMDGPFRSAFRCYFFAKRFILNVQQGPE